MNNVKNEAFNSNVQTVGLLLDESKFDHLEELIQELILNGIAPQNIKVIAYRSKFDKKKEYARPTFGSQYINWKGEITADFLTQFTETKFDLLISYYEVETAILMLITSKSKARFKVGFASVDTKLNRLMIDSAAQHYKLFISELFKYLKSIK